MRSLHVHLHEHSPAQFAKASSPPLTVAAICERLVGGLLASSLIQPCEDCMLLLQACKRPAHFLWLLLPFDLKQLCGQLTQGMSLKPL